MEETQRIKGKVFSFPERLDGVLNIVSWRMYTERGNPLFSFRCVQLKLRWKTQTIYTRGHLLSVSSCTKEKREGRKNNNFGEMQKSSFVTSVSQSQCHFFFF